MNYMSEPQKMHLETDKMVRRLAGTGTTVSTGATADTVTTVGTEIIILRKRICREGTGMCYVDDSGEYSPECEDGDYECVN